MKKNIKAKWLTALQSGKYTHSVGELEEIAPFSDEGTGKCCALGVLMKINGYNPWNLENLWSGEDCYGETTSQELPSEEILEECGMDEEDANYVAKWNDLSKDYTKVIRFIEESL